MPLAKSLAASGARDHVETVKHALILREDETAQMELGYTETR